MAKKKESKALYDENGNWLLEKSMIKGAIRRTFRLSPAMKQVLMEARIELPPKTLKDGSIGKKNQVRYKCAKCGKLFPQTEVQVDHCSPVTPLHRKDADMSYDEIVRGVFCNKSNLQVLCSTKIKLLPKGQRSCHSLKTNFEGFIRDKFSEYLKNNKLDLNEVQGLTLKFEKMYEAHLENTRKIAEEKEARKQAKLLKKTKRLVP